jgi:hypothetical protein
MALETCVHANTVGSSLRGPFGSREEEVQTTGSASAEYSFTSYPAARSLVVGPTEASTAGAFDLPA